MGGFDQQFMVAKETTYATPVTVTRGFGYDGDPMPITPHFGRTEGSPIRPGSRFPLSSRVVPYFDYADGHVDLEVMNKGFGFWLEHMLGTVATTGAGPYVHTGTEGTTSALVGKGITGSSTPFSPTQTNQAWTFGGGKVFKWSLGNTVDNMLLLGLDLWFNQYTTATALATYTEPASMTNFAWTGCRHRGRLGVRHHQLQPRGRQRLQGQAGADPRQLRAEGAAAGSGVGQRGRWRPTWTR
jgi:hypothetical protein